MAANSTQAVPLSGGMFALPDLVAVVDRASDRSVKLIQTRISSPDRHRPRLQSEPRADAAAPSTRHRSLQMLVPGSYSCFASELIASSATVATSFRS